jgi:hypothetical protein
VVTSGVDQSHTFLRGVEAAMSHVDHTTALLLKPPSRPL